MKEKKKILRCAVYTRKSHEDGLEQEYNSLDAQREAGENYIASQKLKGWKLIPQKYDDGGFSGGNMQRPALKQLMADIEAGKIDVVVTYKLDRLSRSLLDFMNLADFFEQHGASFVSVTQEINTSTSAGRMMLNILMTFAQYEREVIAERIRDKIAGAKKRGKHCGGVPVLGYDTDPETKKLVINESEAELVRYIFERYSQIGSARFVAQDLNEKGHRTKTWITRKGKLHKGGKFKPDIVYRILKNPLYIGKVTHKDKIYIGEQKAIVTKSIWEEAQSLLAGNLVAKTRRKTEITTPFRGLLKCGHCGGSMGLNYTQKTDRRYIYYICEADAKKATSDCPIKRVPAGEIKRLVLKNLSEIFKKPTLLAKTYFKAVEMEEAQKNKLLKRRKGLLAQQEKMRQQTILAVQNSDGDNQDEIKSARDNFEQVTREISEINTALEALKAVPISNEDIIKTFASIDVLWDELFPVERYRLLHLLIEKITITTDGIRMELKTSGMGSLIGELMETENMEAV